jgi:hypothetical protein
MQPTSGFLFEVTRDGAKRTAEGKYIINRN